MQEGHLTYSRTVSAVCPAHRSPGACQGLPHLGRRLPHHVRQRVIRAALLARTVCPAMARPTATRDLSRRHRPFRTAPGHVLRCPMLPGDRSGPSVRPCSHRLFAVVRLSPSVGCAMSLGSSAIRGMSGHSDTYPTSALWLPCTRRAWFPGADRLFPARAPKPGGACHKWQRCVGDPTVQTRRAGGGVRSRSRSLAPRRRVRECSLNPPSAHLPSSGHRPR